jgi:pyruvate carboxylase
MTETELRNQELNRHEQKVDQNVERHQAMNLDEKKRDIAVVNQNSAVARIVNIVYFLFGTLELLLAVRVIFYLISVNPDNGFARFIEDLSSPFVALLRVC